MITLLDNTVLSNFALVGKPESLHECLGETAVTTQQVMDEFLAARRQGRVLTDDRDARKLAAQLRVPVSGTLGVLLYLVEEQRLSVSEANQLLHEMVAKGYRSPVDRLDQFLL